jgi:hypothetical protein
MPQYRVLQTSFINNAIVHEGEVVEYDGEAGSNLEPIEDEKPAKSSKGKAKGGDTPTGDGGDLV